MLKRFFWASLFSIIPILVLVPFNHYLITNVHDFGEGSDRNFIALILIESLIIFLISFTLVNAYFNLHPLNRSIISFGHTKEKHPDIPEKYYNNTTNDEQKEDE